MIIILKNHRKFELAIDDEIVFQTVFGNFLTENIEQIFLKLLFLRTIHIPTYS